MQPAALLAAEHGHKLFAHGRAAADPGNWFLDWPFEPLVWVSAAAAGWLYVRGASRVAGWPRIRRLHFLAGLGVLTLALGSPLAVYEGALFWVHMVQHVLLMLVAAPLLVLGAPATLVLRASGTAGRRRASRFLGSRFVRMATHPVIAWLLFVGTIVFTHFSGIYDAALENESLHWLEHALYLGSSLLFWWPVVGIDPSSHRLPHPVRAVYLLLTMPVQAFVALAIYSSGTVLYEHYETLQRSWGPDPLADQRAAAVVMWVGGDGLILLSIVLTVVAWMHYDDRMAAQADRRAMAVWHSGG